MSGKPVETLVDLILHREQHTPHDTAFHFLDADVRITETISYEELAAAARRAAAVLAGEGARGERVLLVTAPGQQYIEWFAGCLLAGAVAVPALPPTNRPGQRRLAGLVADAQARFVVGAARYRTRLPDDAVLGRARWIDEDAHLTAEPLAAPVAADPGDTAFLQYTSGSTTEPRGVVLPHRALLRNVRQIADAFGLGGRDVGVSWLPPYHDMGLIGGLLTPLFLGFPMALMDPGDFGRRPLAWLEAVSLLGATVSGGPNAAFEACAKELAGGGPRLAGLDLSSWSIAFTGAEPVRHETMERFTASAGPYGFRASALYPCYGLAEATLLVSAAPGRVLRAGPTPDPGAAFVSCGPPADGVGVRIVDGTTGRELPAGAVGEIWLDGPAITAGYWNAPGATREVFQCRTDRGEGPYLRTGDLGFLTGDGELVPTGRLKDLLVVRGRNVYPQDLEAAARAAVDDLRLGLAAAFPLERDDEIAVIVEAVVPEGEAAARLAAVRSAVVDECGVSPQFVAFARMGTLPRTSSGKIRRGPVRQGFLADECRLVAVLDTRATTGTGQDRAREARRAARSVPEDRRPGFVLGRLREWLTEAGARLAPDEDPPVMSLGLDSLALAAILTRLEELVGHRLPRGDALATGGLTALAALAVEGWTDAEPDLPASTGPAGERSLPLGQADMWFAEARNPGSTNIAICLETGDDGETDRVRSGLRTLCARHDALRTVYREDGAEVGQHVVDGAAEPPLTEVDGSGWTEGELREWLSAVAGRPVPLETAPLLRAWTVLRPGGRRLLLLVVPHLAVDAHSMYLLAAELLGGVGGSGPRATTTFQSHVAAVADLLAGPCGQEAREHWRGVLRDAPARLELPYRRDRATPGSAAGEVTFRIPSPVMRRLDDLAARTRVTRYAGLLAAYAVFLHHRTGQRSVTVGVPMSGRRDERHAETVGMFMNLVPVVTRVRHDTTFGDVLASVQEQLLAAIEHQWYPLAALREDGGAGAAGPWPWFESSFVLHRAPDGLPPNLSVADKADGVPLTGGGRRWTSVRVPRAQDTLPLTLAAGAGEDDEVHVVLRHLTDVLDRRTAEDIADGFPRLLDRLTARPRLPCLAVAAAEVIPACTGPGAARHLDGASPPGSGGDVVTRFRSVVRRYGERLAVVDGRGTGTTYRELWDRVRAGAAELARRGVGAGSRVAVLHRRDGQAVTATLAVVVAGATYVHLDARSPVARLRHMVEESGVALVVTCATLRTVADRLGPPVLTSTALTGGAAPETPQPQPQPPHPDAAAYVSYTSGSSGQPKGVVVPHRAVVAAADAISAPFALGPGDVLCCVSPFGWDLSAADIWASLLRGATLCVAQEEHETDGTALARLLAERGVSVMQTTPSRWRVLLDSGWTPPPGFRAVCGGDSLDPALARRFDALGLHVWNHYGPTEATFWATSAELRERPEGDERVPIGRPLTGYSSAVLDADGLPVADGAVGELCVGGHAVADGYVGNPRLTADRFVPDAFSGRPGARMYRTGDLCRWEEPAGLYHLGRADTQVKVRGYRVELTEIERAAAAHPAVAFAAAGVTREGEVPEIALYLVARPGATVDPREVNRELAKRLPHHMVPTRFATLADLPLNPNGKVDRAALAAVPVHGVGAATGTRPLTPTETLVARAVCEVLDVGQVAAEDDFFLIGGHSLRAMEVASRLRDRTGHQVSVRTLFEHPTVAGLARWLDAREAPEGTPAVPPGGAGALPPDGTVTSGQRRAWLAHRLGADQDGLVLPFLVALDGGAGIDALCTTFDALLTRHAGLCSVFDVVDGEPRQRPGPRPELRITSASGGAEELRREARTRLERLVTEPWSLAAEPPLRCEAVVSPDEGRAVLALAVHHAVFDGWSGRVLLEDLAELYEAAVRGEEPAPPAAYPDPRQAAARQRGREQAAVRAGDAAYFAGRLATARPLQLPLPPAAGDAAPTERARRVQADVGRLLHGLARDAGSTPVVVATAALLMVLREELGETDHVFGLDVANRDDPELARAIGYFGNQIPVRVDLGALGRLDDVVGRLRAVVADALEHARAPYEDIVAETRRYRPVERGELFTVKVVHQFVPRRLPVGGTAELTLADSGWASAADPLGLWIWDDGTSAVLQLHHRITACDADWAGTVLRKVVALLEGAAGSAHPGEREKERMTLSDEESGHVGPDLPAFEDMVPTAVTTAAAARTAVEGSGGTTVLVVTAGGGEWSAPQWLAAHRDRWRAALDERGAVLLRGFDVSDAEALVEATDVVFTAPYATTEHPRALVKGRVVTPVEYPPERELYWHNEDSFNHEWPALLAFACAQPARSGGETTVVDGAVVHQGLDATARRLFERHGVCYVRRYYPGLGLPWQTVFGTEDRQEVERRCRAQGTEAVWEDDVLTTRSCRTAVLDGDGRGLFWFAQVLHWHRHCLDPRTREELTALFGDRLPRSCTYGDGTPIPDDEVERLVTASRRAEYAVSWQRGDLLLVNNQRMAHGRRPYTAPRGILVALGDPTTLDGSPRR